MAVAYREKRTGCRSGTGYRLGSAEQYDEQSLIFVQRLADYVHPPMLLVGLHFSCLRRQDLDFHRLWIKLWINLWITFWQDFVKIVSTFSQGT